MTDRANERAGLDRVMALPATAGAIVQKLLGCSWGRTVRTPDDVQECPARAERIVVVHDGPDAVELRLCPRHVERVEAETTPHQRPRRCRSWRLMCDNDGQEQRTVCELEQSHGSPCLATIDGERVASW